MQIRTLGITLADGQIIRVPFIVSSSLYNSTDFISNNYSKIDDAEIESLFNSFFSGNRAFVRTLPIIYYDDGLLNEYSIERLKHFFPNSYSFSYDDPTLIKIFGNYTWGALIDGNDNVGGRFYGNVNDYIGQQFPVINSDYNRYGNDKSFSCSGTISVIPDDAVVNDELVFNSEIFHRGMITLHFGVSHRYGNGYTDTTWLSFIISEGPKYSSLLDSATGTKVPIYNPDDPYNPGGYTGPEGGNGSYDDGTSDDIASKLPNGSTENDTSSNGLFTRYIVNSSQLSALGDFLWADTAGGALQLGLAQQLFGQISDSIISLVSYPFSLADMAGQVQPIRLGCLALLDISEMSIVSAPVLNVNGYQHDWGTIQVGTSPTYFDNFIDYSGHTKISLYLPWGTGFVDLDPAEVNGKVIGVKTNFEFSKGTCVHTVTLGGHVIGTYSGVCGKQLPITSGSPALGAAALAGAAVASGVGLSFAPVPQPTPPAAPSTNAIGPGTSIGPWLGSTPSIQTNPARLTGDWRRGARVGNLLSSMASRVSRSGSFQEGNAGLGIQQPFLVYARPDMKVPKDYAHFHGYPSNITGTVSAAGSGNYFEVGEVHLDGVPCTDVEGAEIDAILKGGAIW